MAGKVCGAQVQTCPHRKFGIAEMLETEVDVYGFLAEACANDAPEEFVNALDIVARASLYKGGHGPP